MRHAPASNQRHVELPNFPKMCPILAERGLLPASPCERQGRKPPPTGARKQAIHYGPTEDRRASCLSLYRDIGHRANCRRPLFAPRTRKRAIDLLLAASRLRRRPYRALHSLMPPLRLMRGRRSPECLYCGRQAVVGRLPLLQILCSVQGRLRIDPRGVSTLCAAWRRTLL
jgi:hypothetical protein